MMESWNIGLGSATVIKRLVLAFFASVFWIGRIDVTFLSEHVSFRGWGFDTAPKEYRKELLVHDAHHHPYLERLGCMYMMRYKHGKYFCNDAGVAWRNLFVMALMPWLMKYRTSNEKKNKQNKQLKLAKYYQWLHDKSIKDSVTTVATTAFLGEYSEQKARMDNEQLNNNSPKVMEDTSTTSVSVFENIRLQREYSCSKRTFWRNVDSDEVDTKASF